MLREFRYNFTLKKIVSRIKVHVISISKPHELPRLQVSKFQEFNWKYSQTALTLCCKQLSTAQHHKTETPYIMLLLLLFLLVLS